MEQEQQDSNKGQKVTFGKEMAVCPGCGSFDVSTMVPAFYDQLHEAMEQAQPIESYEPYSHICNNCDHSFDDQTAKYFMWSDVDEYYALHNWWMQTRHLRADQDYLNASDWDVVSALTDFVPEMTSYDKSLIQRTAPLLHVAKTALHNSTELDYLVDRLLEVRYDFEIEESKDESKPMIQTDIDKPVTAIDEKTAKLHSRLNEAIRVFQEK